MTPKTVLSFVGLALVAAAGFIVGSRYMKLRLPPANPPVQLPATPLPTPTSPPTAQAPAPTAQPVGATYALFLVALGDNGAGGKMIGCGDSLVPVGTSATNVTDALNALFAIKTQFYGQSGLDTALSSSTLKLGTVTTSRIDLSGSFSLGGECDDPRAEGQINATVHQFPGYETTPVYVNGKTLKDALSLK